MAGTNRTVLVTGASGQLGRRTVEELLGRKGLRVIAASRSPEKLQDLAAKGAEIRKADFDDVASLEAAFQGVDRVLVISTDALDRPGRRVEQHGRAFAAAEKAGVRHVVYTSLTGADPGSPIMISPDHEQSEAALARTKVGHTILRNNMYAEMLLGSLPRAVATGALYAAAGTGGAGYVTRDDCARAAAGALASDFEGRRTLDITGPSLVTHAQLAQAASEITGKPVKYVAVELETIVQGMVGAGLPEPIARVYASFDTGIAQGTLGVASGAVQELSGRPATSVTEFLLAHKAALLG